MVPPGQCSADGKLVARVASAATHAESESMLHKLHEFHSSHCPILAVKRRVCQRRHGA